MTAADGTSRDNDQKTISVGPLQTPTSSNKADSFARRSYARCSLTARIRGRIQNEVITANPWSAGPGQDTIPGNRQNETRNSLTSMSALIPTSVFKSAKFRGVEYGPQHQVRTSNSAHRTRVSHNSHFKSDNDVDDKQNQKFTQYMTISQVREILNARSNIACDKHASDSAHFPDIKIKIASVPEYYPNIKVMVDKGELVKSRLSAGKSHKNVRHDDLKDTMHVTRMRPKSTNEHEALPGVRMRSAPASQNDRHYIDILEKNRLGSGDKTKQWIMNNPLGPEPNTEYSDDEDIELNLKPGYTPMPTSYSIEHHGHDKSHRDKSRKGGESKRVRFCSDKWMLKDDSYLFEQ